MNKSQKDATKELSDFLEFESKKVPYSCSNWDEEASHMRKPYEVKKSFSDRYLKMPRLEDTQYIDEEDIPKDVDWSLPETVIEETPVRKNNYHLAIGLAVIIGFSLSYCSNNSAPREKKKYETEHSVSAPQSEPAAFRQGAKK